MTYRVDVNDRTATITFDTLSDYVSDVYAAADIDEKDGGEDWWTRQRQDSTMIGREKFTGVQNIANAVRLAERGLKAEGFESVDIAKDVILELQQDRQLPETAPVFDVSGMDVDMDRYLTGEPECMIEYPLTEILSTGPVVTLVVGMNYSAIVSKDAILTQGRFCVALALALAECGYSLEIWSEIHTGNRSPKLGGEPNRAIKVRVKVLEAGTSIDPGGLMFGLAHPSMLRVFGFAAMHLAPEVFRNSCGVGNGYGHPWPIDSAEWPDNAIILNTRRGESTTEELREEVLAQLAALGIVKGDDES